MSLPQFVSKSPILGRCCGVSYLLKEFGRGMPSSRSDTATSSVMVGVNADRVLK